MHALSNVLSHQAPDQFLTPCSCSAKVPLVPSCSAFFMDPFSHFSQYLARRFLTLCSLSLSRFLSFLRFPFLSWASTLPLSPCLFFPCKFSHSLNGPVAASRSFSARFCCEPPSAAMGQGAASRISHVSTCEYLQHERCVRPEVRADRCSSATQAHSITCSPARQRCTSASLRMHGTMKTSLATSSTTARAAQRAMHPP